MKRSEADERKHRSSERVVRGKEKSVEARFIEAVFAWGGLLRNLFAGFLGPATLVSSRID